jgi:hypothetical protein
MIFGGLVVVGAITTGGWIYHHLVVRPLQEKVTALQGIVSHKK